MFRLIHHHRHRRGRGGSSTARPPLALTRGPDPERWNPQGFLGSCFTLLRLGLHTVLDFRCVFVGTTSRWIGRPKSRLYSEAEGPWFGKKARFAGPRQLAAPSATAGRSIASELDWRDLVRFLPAAEHRQGACSAIGAGDSTSGGQVSKDLMPAEGKNGAGTGKSAAAPSRVSFGSGAQGSPGA